MGKFDLDARAVTAILGRASVQGALHGLSPAVRADICAETRKALGGFDMLGTPPDAVRLAADLASRLEVPEVGEWLAAEARGYAAADIAVLPAYRRPEGNWRRIDGMRLESRGLPDEYKRATLLLPFSELYALVTETSEEWIDTGVPVAARAYPERNPVRGLMVPRDRLKSAVESVLRATRAFLEALNSSLCLQPQDAPLSSPAIVTAAPAEGLGAAPKHPTAFLSYAWDSLDHKTWVHELATRLRRDGVESVLDQWALAPGDQLPEFMERACRDSDFVVIICTPEYKLKSDGRKGGVGYEGDIMTAEVLRTRKHRKFVPVLRGASAEESTPAWLAGKFHIDLRGVPFSEAEYQKLVRALHGALPAAPAVAAEPPLFVSDSQLAEAEAPPRRLSDEFSDLGARLLEHVIRRSANGVVWDPMLGTEEVLRELTMTPEDFADAANELEEQGLLRIRKDANSRHGIAGVGPEARCFARYDAFIQPWDPARDAEAVAEQLLASPGQAVGTRPLATALGWPLRRLNPAIAVLDEEGVVRIPRVVLGDGAVIGPYVHATDKIRRWLRASRGDR